MRKIQRKISNPFTSEDAANSCLANLPGVEQLELLCSLVEIVAQRYAISPLLDFTAFRPQLDVDGVTCL